LGKNFGEILRVVVGGVMDVLQARQTLKNEFRLGVTTFKAADNNPLKFSANVDDACTICWSSAMRRIWVPSTRSKTPLRM
jgi:predicted component of type VI protein secretion system